MTTLLVAISAAGAVIVSDSLSLIRLLEWSVLDRFFQLRPTELRDRRVAIVTIGEEDIRHIGDWPMPDRVMAKLLQRIAADGPRAIGVDIYRDIPVEPGTQELRALWQQLPNVVGIEKVAPPPIAPPPFLPRQGERVAASDLLLDLDGKVRRSAISLGQQEGLGFRLALLYLEVEGVEPEVIDAPRFVYRLGRATFRPLRPGDASYRHEELGGYQILLNYRGQWRDSFLLVPLRAVLPRLNSESSLPPGTILPVNFFRDRVVLIGAEAPSLNDNYLTSVGSTWFAPGELMPGVAVHASLASQTIAAALDGRPLLVPLPAIASRLWISGCALGSAILGRRFIGARRASSIGLGLLLLTAIAIPYGSFLGGRLLPVFKPVVAILLGAGASISIGFWERLQQSYRALEESNRTLETKVRRRTAELAAANNNLEEANVAIVRLNEELKDENLRLAAEIGVTQTMQRMVLPKATELEAIPGLDVAAYMEPATEVGGDYYDIFTRGEDTMICIGDVTGHGLESGILMLMAQTGVRALAERESDAIDPVRFLDTLNRTLYKNLLRMDSQKNMTLAVLVYRQGRLHVSGQHEETIVVRASGCWERIDTLDLGFPIGLDTEIAEFISQQEISLQTGDLVILYTDGITEAESPTCSQYGIERLCTVACQYRHLPAAEIVDRVVTDVRAHIDSQQVYDDITLVILKQLPL